MVAQDNPEIDSGISQTCIYTLFKQLCNYKILDFFNSKKMSKFNKDILFLIFEELQDDSKSLFSCLMVNRIWCETVIPVLWRNPWRYDIVYSNKSYLFIIFISCLSNNIKESLTSKGIQLPPISYQSLLFDYLTFCRSINIDIMNHIISTETSSDYDQFLLQQEFYNIL